MYGHCDLVSTFIVHCECFRSITGISIKNACSNEWTFRYQCRSDKWLKIFRYWCRSVRRHFGTDAELVRTLLTQNAGTEMVWYRGVLIPKCPVTIPAYSISFMYEVINCRVYFLTSSCRLINWWITRSTHVMHKLWMCLLTATHHSFKQVFCHK